MEEVLEIKIEKSDKRLDLLLKEILSDKSLTRSKIQRLIEEKKILLNGRETKASEIPKVGDVVKVIIEKEENNLELVPLEFPLKIWYEDEDLFVVEKPPNLVTHPACGHRNDTLVNILLSLKVPLSSMYGKERAGIVHRLDKETSGLLMIAKNERVHEHLSRQFSERKIYKEYLALIWGSLNRDKIELNLKLKRDKKNRKKICVSDDGRISETTFEVLEVYRFISLIKCIPKTGRTHQIRVHLSYLKHPIVGDYLYGGKIENGIPYEKLRNFIKESKRFFLHSHRLVFKSLDGKEIEVVSPIPEDFEKLIEIVRSYG